MQLHTFAVYVENQPGVLNRVASLFRRRGFNIHSLSVGTTEDAGISRMTVVVPTDDGGAARVRAHLEKLVPVLRVEDLSARHAVVRDLALIKVSATHENRAAVMQLADVFDGRVVDVAPASVVVEICASEAKVDGLLEVLRPYGVLEMVRTGRVAMDRGSVVDTPREEASEGEPSHGVVYYDADADLSLIKGRKVAILGYGSQGHAHALNLRDSGVDVRVGLPAGSSSRAKAQAQGVTVLEPAQACAWADVIMVLVPDTAQAALYREAIRPHLSAGKTLMFAHGFNVRFGTLDLPADIDVSMIAPKSPGHRVRELYQEGAGTPALLAVHQDATGKARAGALSYGMGIGVTRAGVIETTFAEETETDLFGEQAVLCGGVSALVKAGFDTLTEAGYQPEVAYFECLHELKLIVDLMYQGGLSYMRYSISDTAEHGDYTGGPRLITKETRDEMRRMLTEIQDGTYARRWIAEDKNGRPWFNETRRTEQQHPIEEVGARLRAMMPFLKPVARREPAGVA